jgi:SAM-dependent methyltransferase
MGFKQVRGVEPSQQAVAKSSPAVRSCILNGVLGPDTFDPESFSLICGFQVLDHLLRPNEILQYCWRLLAPGGVMYWICHDIGWWLPRLLGRSSPIIDIEHVVLFDRRTVRRLFENNHFEVVEVAGVRNRYPLDYWLHLAPAPARLKAAIRKVIGVAGLRQVTLTANLGNLSIIARKPSV